MSQLLTRPKVGYIGLGNMGKPIAANVLRAGFDLTVYDVRSEPMEHLTGLGAHAATSPREVGERSDIVELSLVDDAQVLDVCLGAGGVLNGAAHGSIIAIHSTIHPETARTVGERARERGVGVVDAALSGGSGGARARRLCYMVGGEPEHVERCRPVFETSAAEIHYAGALGMGAATKLAQQVIICLNRMAAYEGMKLAERAGVDLEVLQAVARSTTAQSRVVDNWLTEYNRIQGTESTDPMGMAHLFWKGLCPALELGHDLGLSMPATALVQQLFPRILGLADW